MIDKIYKLPAVDLLAQCRAGSAGAVITDPPFFVGIGRDAGGFGSDPWSDLSTIDAITEWSMPLAYEVHRVLRPGGASVVMGGVQSLVGWETACARVGLTWMAELTVLWNTGKPRSRNFGSLTTTIRWHSKPGARHAFNAGDRRSIYSNVIVCHKVRPSERAHPAQKPVELTNFLVSLLTDDGDLIVDPFCGSGSTLVSAAMCGRRYLGGDNDESYCAIAARRVQRIDLEEANLRPLHLWVNGTLHNIED